MIRAILICLLLGGCAAASAKYSPTKGALKNDYEATALALRWGYANNTNLGKVVGYRSRKDAVYLVFKNPEGQKFNFKVQRNPKKVELLSEFDKNAVPPDAR